MHYKVWGRRQGKLVLLMETLRKREAVKAYYRERKGAMVLDSEGQRVEVSDARSS